MTPQWSDINSAVHCLRTDMYALGIGSHNFACPRNGEVILKELINKAKDVFQKFQSPQWWT